MVAKKACFDSKTAHLYLADSFKAAWKLSIMRWDITERMVLLNTKSFKTVYGCQF